LRPWRLFKKNGVLLSPHAPGFLLLRHGIGIGIGIAALAWHGVATTPLGLEPVSAS
jgi:hypothetical protein